MMRLCLRSRTYHHEHRKLFIMRIIWFHRQSDSRCELDGNAMKETTTNGMCMELCVCVRAFFIINFNYEPNNK